MDCLRLGVGKYIYEMYTRRYDAGLLWLYKYQENNLFDLLDLKDGAGSLNVCKIK